ncbi:hypothetical protein ACNTMW_14195 [Planosporangium sp. 12N6]|uniref:phosphoketolase family protein n=1 Tax=Planosporangium spinosum TaxID=3402278 RepID=UPI003CFA2CCC
MTSRRGNPWAQAAAIAEATVPRDCVDAAWRALNYLSAAQLYLRDNLLLERPITAEDVKEHPSGHWGTCPSVNLLLASLGPIFAHAPASNDAIVVHGAGHAGPAALAYGYLTRRLGHVYPRFRQSAAGLRALVTDFPHPDDLGGEITPLLPDQLYMGGQLGPALSFAHGAALDAPDRLVVALIGDGECETGATAAAWLAAHALRGTGMHGRVLPVILLNGLRMGGTSLLGRLGPQSVQRYLDGLGYRPFVVDAPSDMPEALAAALSAAAPLEDGPSSVLICTLPKGHTGPETVDGIRIGATPRVHKTPLVDPRDNRAERDALYSWLLSYRPAELLDPHGRPTTPVSAALCGPPSPRTPNLGAPRGCVQSCTVRAAAATGMSFSESITKVLADSAATGGFRLFSPDELASNRIGLSDPMGHTPPWVVEVLNEEICHAWAQGYLETGRRSVVATYEAFAPIASSLLTQHLKYRALARHAQRPAKPSVVYLITSLGWNNTYSHQNPGFVSALLATEDPSVHVQTPADAPRAAASLTFALRKLDRCSVVIASKHPVPEHPLDTLDVELRDGLAVWPHLTDPESPDLVLAAAGDIAAREMTAAARTLRTRLPDVHLRFVAIHDLTALGSPHTWPLGLSAERFTAIFGVTTPVLLAVPFFPEAARALLWPRPAPERFTIVGYVDPGRPMSATCLLRQSGMDSDSLASRAIALLRSAPPADRNETSTSCFPAPISV